MTRHGIPERLKSLSSQEDLLREMAAEIVERDNRLALHLYAVECAMNLADMLRQYPTDDEDTKVVQVLGMRIFNAFGACIRLGFSGYSQNSALIMRDILETLFLLSLFQSDRAAIGRWRVADKRKRMREFSPLRVREALDARDGFKGKKRAEIYELLSEFAAHPTMKSVFMMRPQQDGNAVIGPFIEPATLEAVLAELGRLSIQAGEVLDHFFPESWDYSLPSREEFAEVKLLWILEFLTSTVEPDFG